MDNKNVLAVVGGKIITQDDVEHLLKGLEPGSAAQFDSEEGRKILLDQIISHELLYLDAVENGLGNSEGYKKEVEMAKINILKQLAINKLLNSVTVEEGEVVGYYNQNMDFFKNPDTVRASHVLVADLESALKILDEIGAGLSFEDAAEKYSSCPSKEQGGDLGYFKKESMVPEFGEAAFEMEIGQISSPVKTQFGFHIIKLLDKKEGGHKSLDDVKSKIAQQILLKKQQDVYLKKTSELRSKYEVKLGGN